MSPRRKFSDGEGPLLVPRSPAARRPGAFPLLIAAAGLLMAAAVTVSSLMLISHRSVEHTAARNRQALDYVAGFMAEFTSVDPYHANDYVSRVLDQATGEFAQEYHDKANEILLQVARAEPATGTVLDASVERWNDDGSVNVMVATAVTSKSADEKQVIENTNRWMATATQEGAQWKISNLLQVI